MAATTFVSRMAKGLTLILELALAYQNLVVPLQDELREPRVPMPRLSACAPAGARTLHHLSDLPPEAVERLRTFFKEGFADAGAAFNATDVISDPLVPQRRFVRAYQHRDRWIIWYEHGGRGYHLHALGMINGPGQSSPEVSPFAWFGGGNTAQLCSASMAFFDGVQTSQEM